MIAPSAFSVRSRASCFDFRIGIEGEAAATAARNRSAADLVRLAEMLERLEHLRFASDPGLDEDFAFHLLVAKASRNAYFVSVLQSLRDTISEGMLLARTALGPDAAGKMAAINEQHRLVYEAIAAEDVEGARKAMRSHLVRCKLSTSHWDLLDAPSV